MSDTDPLPRLTNAIAWDAIHSWQARAEAAEAECAIKENARHNWEYAAKAEHERAEAAEARVAELEEALEECWPLNLDEDRLAVVRAALGDTTERKLNLLHDPEEIDWVAPEGKTQENGEPT